MVPGFWVRKAPEARRALQAVLASLAPAPRDGRGRDARAQEVEYAADWLREAGTKAWQLAGALADPALRGDPAPR